MNDRKTSYVGLEFGERDVWQVRGLPNAKAISISTIILCGNPVAVVEHDILDLSEAIRALSQEQEILTFYRVPIGEVVPSNADYVGALPGGELVYQKRRSEDEVEEKKESPDPRRTLKRKDSSQRLKDRLVDQTDVSDKLADALRAFMGVYREDKGLDGSYDSCLVAAVRALEFHEQMKESL